MTKIQFSHANGFGAKTYGYFFEQLAPCTINAVELIGHGKHELKKNWKDLVPELIESIETNFDEPIVGIGHSMGAAITFFAAIQRPDLFKQIIIIEPPVFSFNKRMMIGLMSLTGAHKNIGIAQKAKNRRRYFDSKAAAYDALKDKRLFKSFHPQCFRDYIEHGLKDSSKGGVELTYSADMEFKVFTSTPIFLGNTSLKVPADFIYSNQYKTLDRADIKWWEKTVPQMTFHEFKGGHLFPLEKPYKTAAFIKRLIEKKELVNS